MARLRKTVRPIAKTSFNPKGKLADGGIMNNLIQRGGEQEEDPYTVIDNNDRLENIDEFIFALPDTAEQINLIFDIISNTDNVRLILEYSTDGGSSFDPINYSSFLVTSGNDSGGFVSRVGTGDGTICQDFGNDVNEGISATIRITGHNEASAETIATIDGNTVSPSATQRKNEGTHTWSITTNPTHARLTLSSGAQMSTMFFSLFYGPIGTEFPFFAGQITDLSGLLSKEFNLGSSELYNLAYNGVTSSINNDDIVSRVRTGGTPQTSGYAYHLQETSAALAAYAAQASSSATEMLIQTGVSSAPDKTSENHLMITSPSTRDLIKPIVVIGGSSDSIDNARNAFGTAAYNGGFEGDPVTAIIIQPRAGNFATGKARLREIAINTLSDVGKVFGPWKLSEIIDFVDEAQVDLDIGADISLRHIFLFINTTVSVDGAQINSNVTIGGLVISGYRWHLDESRSSSDSYLGSRGTSNANYAIIRDVGAAPAAINFSAAISPQELKGYTTSNSAHITSGGNVKAANMSGRPNTVGDIEVVSYFPSSGTFSGRVLHYKLSNPSVDDDRFPFTFPFTFNVRNFTTLEAAGLMHYQLPDLGTATTLATIKASFTTTSNDANFRFVVGRHSGDRFYIGVNLGQLVIGHGSSFTGSLGAVDDGKFHTVSVTITSTTVVAVLDGIEVLNSVSDYTLDMSAFGIGMLPDQPDFFNGVIADVRITGAEIDATPVDIFYPIDEDWFEFLTLHNAATTDGRGDGVAVNITAAESEPFDFIGGDWLGFELAAAGAFDFTTTGIGEQVNQAGSGALKISQMYKVIADNATANTFNFVPFGGAYVASIDAIDTATSTAVTWEGNQIGDYELSNISVKRILEVANP